MKGSNNMKGTLILISAPSGGGKNAVIQSLMRTFGDAVQLVTTTSRPPREGEKHGVDYYFISKEEFQQKLDIGDFVEYNEYAGNYYGTEWAELHRCEESAALVFSQAEVHGKRSLDALKVPHISVFLLPESLEILEKRLEQRGGMARENIERRLEIAKAEIAEAETYDLPIVNTDGKMAETVDRIATFIRERVPGLRTLDNKDAS